MPQSYWSIVKPQESNNRILNPSGEINVTGYTNEMTGGSGVYQYGGDALAGVYSIQWVPGTSGTPRLLYSQSGFSLYDPATGQYGGIFSLYIKRQDGGAIVPTAGLYTLVVDSSQPEIIPHIKAVSNGWYRLWTKVQRAGATNHDVGIRLDIGYGYFIDAMMLEPGNLNPAGNPSTYLDGDQPGCYWSGVPHASTSYRLAGNYGGEEHDFTEYGVYPGVASGAGMYPVKRNSASYALQPGAYRQGYKIESRDIVIPVVIKGSSRADLHQKRTTFENQITPERTGDGSAFELRYSGSGKIMAIQADYAGGLDELGIFGNASKAGIQFRADDPYFYGPAGALKWTLTQSVANVNYILMRRNQGLYKGKWAALDIGFNNTVYSLVFGPRDNRLYAAGAFTDKFGLAGTALNHVAYFDVQNMGDGSAAHWQPLSTGTAGQVNQLAFGLDGKWLYAAGATFGGARIDTSGLPGATWSALAIGAPANTVVAGYDGSIYFGGNGGVQRYDPSTAGVSTIAGTSGTIATLVVGLDGSIYASSLGNTIYRLAPGASTFTSFATSDGYANGMAVDQAGTLYVAGGFNTMGGVTSRGVAMYKGNQWLGMGVGLSGGASGTGNAVNVAPDGSVYVGSDSRWYGGRLFADSIGKWINGQWLPVGIDLPGSAAVYAIAYDRYDNLVLGFNTSGNAVAPVAQAINNGANSWQQGSATTYPKITLMGDPAASSKVYEIRNYTTGQAIYLDLTIYPAEYVTLDLTPGVKRASSQIRPNLQDAILPGSNWSDWSIIAAQNIIGIYTDNANLGINFAYPRRYNGIDG